jgi:hypothetical protein
MSSLLPSSQHSPDEGEQLLCGNPESIIAVSQAAVMACLQMTCLRPDNPSFILSACHKPYISSDNCTCTSIITRTYICIHIHPMTVCKPTWLSSGVRAFTPLSLFCRWMCFVFEICKFTLISTCQNIKSTIQKSIVT